jgi:hypothetical protein
MPGAMDSLSVHLSIWWAFPSGNSAKIEAVLSSSPFPLSIFPFAVPIPFVVVFVGSGN